jgi:hypothetical protein
MNKENGRKKIINKKFYGCGIYTKAFRSVRVFNNDLLKVILDWNTYSKNNKK